jgi:uncharacterized membrane protein
VTHARGLIDMDQDDPREEISRLEARIEELAATIENCRKIIAAAKAAIVLGAALLIAVIVGIISFDPMIFMAAVAALLGGIVLLGSNNSTALQKTAELNAAEAQRAALINQIDLRIVGAARNAITG